jgi:hypothetical protein
MSALLLLCAVAAAAAAATPSISSELFRSTEVRLAFAASHTNPWAITNCTARVLGPASSRHAAMVLPLFYDGMATIGTGSSTSGPGAMPPQGLPSHWSPSHWSFAFRLTPDVVGTWSWTLACAPLRLANESASGSITVSVAPSGCRPGRGGAVASRLSPQQFEREDGSRWTPLGYEIDWLWALGMNESATAIAPVEDALGVLAGYGFNHLLVSLYANHSIWNQALPKVPPHVYWTEQVENTPWETMADRSRLNLRFLRHWDRVLDAADARDVVIHLMHYVGNKNVAWPEKLSGDDDIYWRNVLARYASHPAVIIDVSKEAASYGVGAPYILNRLQLIHESNAHMRLVTAHSGLSWSEKCAGCGLTMLSTQTHLENQTSGGFTSNVRKIMDANPTTPVANVEFMYVEAEENGVVCVCAAFVVLCCAVLCCAVLCCALCCHSARQRLRSTCAIIIIHAHTGTPLRSASRTLSMVIH